MKKRFLCGVLGLIGMMGTLSIFVVKANDTSGVEGDINQLVPVEKGSTLKSVGDTQLNWTEGVDFFTISIAKPEGVTDDGPAGFTIMDRNLGATTTGYGASAPTASYGFKYQWGNNFGFRDSDSVTAVTAGLTYNSIYDNHGYYSTNFINGSSHDYDVWDGTNPTANGKEHHDGLWGGANDSSSNNRGANQTNPTDRQGPCPVGYHVPSAGEWGLLIKYWADTKDNGTTKNAIYGGSAGLYYLNSNYSAFQQKFNLPFAGYRNYSNASLRSQGSSGIYWSSSPYGSDYPSFARILYLGSSDVRASYVSRADGYSVRCFKDSYEAPSISYTLELNANGGEVAETTLETDNEGKVTLPTASREADANGERVFEGWFADEGVSEKIGNPGDEITLTADMDVYAHWAQTITIRDPANPLSGFTIMDRNLGATTDDITSADSYGFHYQWGNNYGFLQSLNKTDNPEYFTGTRATYDSYGPANPYSNPLFRRGNSMYDYWESDTHYDNLWGGDEDYDNGWDNGNSKSDRQGPCPADYHVPSQKEWNDLLVLYRSIYTGVVTDEYTDDWGTYYLGDTFGDDFASYFKLPFAGSRGFEDASLFNQGSYGIYWSSSPYSASSEHARLLRLRSSYVYADNDSRRAYGNSVRCFKDSYVAPISYTLTFDSQGGDEVATGVAVENTSRSRPENPSKSGYTFVDWYTTTGYESAFDFTGTLATGNLTVYAKWHYDSCPENYDYNEDTNTCFVANTSFGTAKIYYGIDLSHTYSNSPHSGHQIGTITIVNPNDDTESLTLMDMNLGATSLYVTGTSYSSNDTIDGSFGELYQRGNNAPIKYASTGVYSTSPAIYENYWPGHPYNVSTFINGNRDYWHDNKHYDNLWGGSGDDTAGDWGGINNGDTRQGPCPEGYHVPSMQEWETVLQYFASGIGQNLTPSGDFYYFSNGQNRQKFQDAFLLPRAGYRHYVNASLISQGSNGYYWSSSPYGSDYPLSARYLLLNSSTVYASDYSNRAYGNSVRCFKDSYVAPISYILEFDANGGELSGADSEGKLLQKVESGKKAQQPQGISKDGAVFQNWVYSGDEATAFDFSAPVNSNSQLKAEWATLYTLTIHYVNSKGGEVFPDYTGSYVSGASYSVDSQAKEHYTIDKATISGVMGNSDVEETVTYSTETEDTNDNGIADEDETHYLLTIHYVNSKGGEVFADYTGSYVSGASYSVDSTPKEYYTIDKATISGVMGNSDVEETVTYSTETEDTNDNGIADEDETHYLLTIHYVNSKGGEVFADYTGSYVSGASYSVDSQAKEHYTIDKATISGVMGNSDVEETVTYTANNDKNNNGIADEDEGYKPSGGSSGGGGGGGGGGGSSKTETGNNASSQTGNQINSNTGDMVSTGTNEKEPESGIGKNAETQTGKQVDSQTISDKSSEGQEILSPSDGSFTKEQKEAYEFAKGHGITTMPTIQKANMNGKLTRIAMAKMLSQYAINILGKKPKTTIIPKFNDVTEKMNSDYDNGVTLAYQLGIMGQNMPGNNFRPNDEVTRAEFATALSRMLYNTSDGKYKSTSEYYINHMKKLKEEGIITKDDPSMKELRGYVMIMLMRSAK